MKKTVAGILAHVDAGKTTLSEALLYVSGALRKIGRVDHGDAFLDTDVQERERGITIFSKQAILSTDRMELTLLDTPGHADFSSEMERTLSVLDCAILVLSGIDGIQGHTRTLWKLLERYHIPTFIFINKMDLAGADKGALISSLKEKLSEGCVDFDSPDRDEHMAATDEAAIEEYFASGSVCDDTAARLIAQRKVFPCLFGSALKLTGVGEFLACLERFAPSPVYPKELGAKVFKISRDSKNMRLTWLKVTGGVLRSKMPLTLNVNGEKKIEKADQLRIYSGTRFSPAEEALPGTVVAVTGLDSSRPGMGIGCEGDSMEAMLEPVLNYRLMLPQGTDPMTVLPKLRQLEEEDPLLRVLWQEALGEIHLRLMGRVQLEVLTRLLKDRFGIDAAFDRGNVVYRETIKNTVEGVGHFEPLRHYAEVHLILEPGPKGSGITSGSSCSVNDLDLNWQRLIMTHISERSHPGVLTGSPITDIKITLAAGRAHLKHTEGGDFRQATYRAIRQGLMQAETELLEPCYDISLEVPQSALGRALTDLQNMGAVTDPPVNQGDTALVTGFGPVSKLQNYSEILASYTRGLGRLSCTFHGYEPCHNTTEVVEALAYDPERDVLNPADSVFCSHGAGVNVKWNEVFSHMHLESVLRPKREKDAPAPAVRRSGSTGAALDRELMAIYEMTYGKIQPRAFESKRPAYTGLKDSYDIRPGTAQSEYLLVDGYNIIFAWQELKELAALDIASARDALTDILINYRAFKKCSVILVFDAYKVKGNPGAVEEKGDIFIVYTKEAETADTYIERTAARLEKQHTVRVATSDYMEQMIIIGHGAHRISADAFHKEVEEAKLNVSRFIEEYNSKNRGASSLGDSARVIRENQNGK